MQRSRLLPALRLHENICDVTLTHTRLSSFFCSSFSVNHCIPDSRAQFTAHQPTSHNNYGLTHGLSPSPSSVVIGYYPHPPAKGCQGPNQGGAIVIQRSITALTSTSELPVQTKPQEILILRRRQRSGSYFGDPEESVFLTDQCHLKTFYKMTN